MANLLPQDKKKEVRKEYRLRVFTFLLFMFGGVFVIMIILLFSLHILLNNRLSNLNQIITITSEEGENLEKLKQAKDDTLARLKLLRSENPSLRVSYGIFKTVFDIKPKNIFLTKIAYSNDQIIVGGLALCREDLQKFVVGIGKHEQFLPVDYPFSNITKKDNIDFSLTINMTTHDEK